MLIGCLLAGPAEPLMRGEDSKPVVEARTLLAADAAHAGSSVKAAVVAEVAPGFHINAHKPTLDYLIPTELKLQPTQQLSAEKMVYPEGAPKKFQFSDTVLSVYEGKLVVGALLKVAPAVRPGTYTMSGKFTYQACSDHACLPPRSIPVSLAVKVVPRGVPVKRLNADVFGRIQFD